MNNRIKYLKEEYPFIPEAVLDCIEEFEDGDAAEARVIGYRIRRNSRDQLRSLMLLSGAIQTDDNWIRSTCISGKDFECGLITNRTVFIVDLNRHFQGVYFHGVEDDFHTPTEGPDQDITASDGETSLQAEAWLDELTEKLS